LQAKIYSKNSNSININSAKIPVKLIAGLPINEKWAEISESIEKNSVVIIAGETGSGKTTQIPKICLEAGRGFEKKIVCTQPRRIAATSVSRRVSEELGEEYGKYVGFKIRFNDKTTPLTRIKFVTDGILLSEFKNDPLLREYDTIIIDEAHERSLNIDFLLGIMKKILPKRKDLRLIISSATIDTEFFSNAFDNATVINVSGRGYPVDIIYDPFENPEYKDFSLIEKTLFQIETIHNNDPFGDILVFLPTERDIIDVLKELRGLSDAVTLPVFSRLAASEQQKIFKPASHQKIVLATNIAETSITVPGIKYVIDTGFARISSYNWRTGIKSLPISLISRSSADQRAGRAGRICPGKCYRLYSREDYEAREQYTKPEILRSNLAEVILKIIDLNLGKIEDFPFLTPPSNQSIREGINTLKEIGALDNNEKLTQTGKMLSGLPIDPRIGRMIIQARHEGSLREIIIIASALSIQDPRERPVGKEKAAENAHNKFKDDTSDFITLLNIWNEFESQMQKGISRKKIMRFCETNFLSYNRMMEWKDIKTQINLIVIENKEYIPNKERAKNEAIHRSILSGFLSHIAFYSEGIKYKGAKGKEIHLFPGSSVYKKRPKWIVSTDIMRTSQLFARLCAEIQPQWIEDLAGEYKKFHYSQPHFEKSRGEVMAFEKVTVFGLTVTEGRKKSFGRIDPKTSREIFINEGIIPIEIKGNFPFAEHNKKIIDELHDIENRLRSKDLCIENNALYEFYNSAIETLENQTGIKSINNLKDLAKAIKQTGDSILRLDRQRFLEMIDKNELTLYPGYIEFNNTKLTLIYHFSPGDEKDGITVQIPFNMLNKIPEEPFAWLVPGFFEEKLIFMLKKLPPEFRRKIAPISKTASELLNKIYNPSKNLIEEINHMLFKDYAINIDNDLLSDIQDFPPHLVMKFEILDNNGKVIDKGKDLGYLKEKWGENPFKIPENLPEWLAFKSIWEKEDLSLETMPDGPETLDFNDPRHNIILEVYPGLVLSQNKPESFSIKLFQTMNEAKNNTARTIQGLLKNIFKKDLDFIKNKIDLKKLSPEILSYFYGGDRIKKNIISFIIKNFLGDSALIPGKDLLLKSIEELKKSLIPNSLGCLIKLYQVWDALSLLFEEFNKIEQYLSTYKKSPDSANILAILKNELNHYLMESFPENLTITRIEELPRYLKALKIRASRAYVDPQKDMAKWNLIRPYLFYFEEIKKNVKIKDIKRLDDLEKLGKMIEEYKISVFAPEIKVNMPVSPKRLDEICQKFKNN
jgi:ATP-dependent helicase HrpA